MKSWWAWFKGKTSFPSPTSRISSQKNRGHVRLSHTIKHSKKHENLHSKNLGARNTPSSLLDRHPFWLQKKRWSLMKGCTWIRVSPWWWSKKKSTNSATYRLSSVTLDRTRWQAFTNQPITRKKEKCNSMTRFPGPTSRVSRPWSLLTLPTSSLNKVHWISFAPPRMIASR